MKPTHTCRRIYAICSIIIFNIHYLPNLYSMISPETVIITTQITSIQERLASLEAEMGTFKEFLPTHNTVMDDTASSWRSWRVKWSERGKHACYFVTLCCCLDCCGQLKV